MKVQSIPNNNYYNSTFCARPKFDKKKYEELKSLRRAMISGFVAKKFDPDEYMNLFTEFAIKFIKSPQERQFFRPLKSYIKEYVSDHKMGLKQMFYMLRNRRKLKKEFHSMEDTIVQKIKTSKDNIEQSEWEKGVKALKNFFGF